jgi:uncharacterized protein (TIGR03435 family)
MREILVCLLAAALAHMASGQEFEVVSVKPNKSESRGSSVHTNQGRLMATNVNLRSLVVMAYEMKDYQVEAPDWLRSERFDIVAKFPEALPKDRDKYNAALHAMMQKMLVDRFRLATHRDSKTMSVYGLTVGRNGVKFKEVPDGDSHGQNSDNTHYKGTCVNMAAFAEFLSRRMDLPVLDMTGLKGYYDLTLDWVPESKPSADGKGETAPISAAASGPTLLEALPEQLGLKLQVRKAPIEILIVDHAERVPTEN